MRGLDAYEAACIHEEIMHALLAVPIVLDATDPHAEQWETVKQHLQAASELYLSITGTEV